MHLVFAVFDHPSRGPLLPPFDSNPLVFFSVVTIAPFVNTCIFGGMYCVFSRLLFHHIVQLTLRSMLIF